MHGREIRWKRPSPVAWKDRSLASLSVYILLGVCKKATTTVGGARAPFDLSRGVTDCISFAPCIIQSDRHQHFSFVAFSHFLY